MFPQRQNKRICLGCYPDVNDVTLMYDEIVKMCENNVHNNLLYKKVEAESVKNIKLCCTRCT